MYGFVFTLVGLTPTSPNGAFFKLFGHKLADWQVKDLGVGDHAA